MKNVKIIKLVIAHEDYCNYLRTFDNKVPFNYGKKILRPFVGVLFIVDNKEYFAPLSSPKAKHKLLKNNIDLIKIDNGKLGVINLNNMIPITSNNYKIFNLRKLPTKLEERQRVILLRNQLFWLNSNVLEITNKSKRLYQLYKTNHLPSRVKNRCCNFPVLEEKCDEYIKQAIIN